MWGGSAVSGVYFLGSAAEVSLSVNSSQNSHAEQIGCTRGFQYWSSSGLDMTWTNSRQNSQSSVIRLGSGSTWEYILVGMLRGNVRVEMLILLSACGVHAC
jgi:hypothetical protein